MIRKLLATTAIVTITAGGVYAAETPAASDRHAGERFLPSMSEAALASQIIGETVYASTAEDAEAIGEVNDLIVGTDGEIDAAIVAVGGFLGVGEKNVAVSYGDLRLTTEDDGSQYVVLETNKEELETAPEFDMQTAVTPAGNRPAGDNMAADDKVTANDTMASNEPAAETPAAPAREMTGTAPARDTLQTVDVGTISSDNVIGATVYTDADENVGEVSEVVLTNDGEIDAVVIDVGGFLGIGVKPVAVAFSDLEFRSDENGTIYIYTRFTEDQLDAAASYDKDGYQDNRDAMLLRTAS
jgi:sporulation protein YlmC with PRC-barrel domain